MVRKWAVPIFQGGGGAVIVAKPALSEPRRKGQVVVGCGVVGTETHCGLQQFRMHSITSCA